MWRRRKKKRRSLRPDEAAVAAAPASGDRTASRSGRAKEQNKWGVWVWCVWGVGCGACAYVRVGGCLCVYGWGGACVWGGGRTEGRRKERAMGERGGTGELSRGEYPRILGGTTRAHVAGVTHETDD